MIANGTQSPEFRCALFASSRGKDFVAAVWAVPYGSFRPNHLFWLIRNDLGRVKRFVGQINECSTLVAYAQLVWYSHELSKTTSRDGKMTRAANPACHWGDAELSTRLAGVMVAKN